MPRRPSYIELAFPPTGEFTEALSALGSDAMTAMFGYIWRAFDRLYEEVLIRCPPSPDAADLERCLTELLELRLRQELPPELPYDVQHEAKERFGGQARGQPPEPDISFRLRANPRVSFPLEAKVIPNDGDAALADYEDTFRTRLIACAYAAQSREAAMLSYLLSGSVTKHFGHIRGRLGCRLRHYPGMRHRDHKVSSHERTAAACRYRDFRCHHLVFRMTVEVRN